MSKKVAVLSALVALLVGATATSAEAARGGRAALASVASCSVDETTVSASGLPVGEVINFMVTPEGGTTSGWVLGLSDDGTWDVTVPARSGETKYEFASRTWGPNGAKYTVFASCSGA